MRINPTAASGKQPAMLRSIVGGLAGNLIEWYDFLAYSIFSIYFAKAFFPSDNATVQLLALGVLLVMQHVLFTAAQIEQWAWRIPFVIGGLLALFALYMRSNVVESSAFEHARGRHDTTISREMLQHWRQSVPDQSLVIYIKNQ